MSLPIQPRSTVTILATGATATVDHVVASDPDGTGSTYRYLVSVRGAFAWKNADEIELLDV